MKRVITIIAIAAVLALSFAGVTGARASETPHTLTVKSSADCYKWSVTISAPGAHLEVHPGTSGLWDPPHHTSVTVTVKATWGYGRDQVTKTATVNISMPQCCPQQISDKDGKDKGHDGWKDDRRDDHDVKLVPCTAAGEAVDLVTPPLGVCEKTFSAVNFASDANQTVLFYNDQGQALGFENHYYIRPDGKGNLVLAFVSGSPNTDDLGIILGYIGGQPGHGGRQIIKWDNCNLVSFTP